MSADPILHGRDAPLRALRAALDGALVGRGQLALVSGEAGIGKSVLAAQLAREAGARGATVTWGRAWEFADAPPYFPLWPCLRALGVTLGHERRDEGDSFHLWEDVVTSLAQASGATTCVWILEDLHAADLGTLDLLAFLAQPLRAMRVLVVATARAQDPRLTERAAQRLTRMARDGVDVRLEPLGDRDVAALTEGALGRAVPPAALARLMDLTGGNPLFVVECARAFRSAGGIEGTLSSLPPTVRQVVRDRVTLLPESTREALACGAVLGREFSAASVARMERSLPARVIDTLLPALRAGVVVETRPGDFIFSHTLVRDAIDDALGGQQRAALHRRAEAALATLGDGADVLVERARHALAALGPGDEERVLAIAERAADRLENEGAFDRAFELYARLDEARRAGRLPAAPPAKKMHLARVARAAGQGQAGRRLCEEVAVAARAAGDPELLAQAALLYGADLRPGVVDRSLVALLEEARGALAERAPALGCTVLARLAAALQPAPDPELPMEMAREALRRAHRTGDDAVILEVLELAGSALVDYAPMAERLATAAELLERAVAAGDLPKALRAHTRLALAHLEEGNFAAFDRELTSMLALSDQLGHPRYRWRALLIASGRAVTLGNFVESDRYVVEVAQLASLTDEPSLGLSLAAHDLVRKLAQRKDDELPAAIKRLESMVEGVPQAAASVAIVSAVVHARTEDMAATRRALAIPGVSSAAFDTDRTFVAYRAEAYALVGTDDERRTARALLARMSSTELVGGQMSFTHEGTVARVMGLVDAALGDLAGAEQRLRGAHALAVERRHAPWVAQIAYELSKVVGRAGRAAEARALADECLGIARELGMTGLEARAGAGTSLPAAAVVAGAGVVAIALEGDGWRVERGGRAARVKDSRGMRLLARLVERPDEEVHVLALASDETTTSLSETSAGELLDERARRAYRQRIFDLDVEIEEAERHGDLGRLEKLGGERETLQGELVRAVGLGGRARQAGSVTERARVNVQRRVKDAIARIAEVDQELGRFFTRAVRTGTYCCFRP